MRWQDDKMVYDGLYGKLQDAMILGYLYPQNLGEGPALAVAPGILKASKKMIGRVSASLRYSSRKSRIAA